MSNSGNGTPPRVVGRRLPERWDDEGSMDNLLVEGMDLLYYKDFKEGVCVYILLFEGVKQDERTFFWKRDPEDKAALDKAQDLWERAKKAQGAGVHTDAFNLTYDGLKTVFPNLPEVPRA